ncbi:MAG: hypothetical protein AB1896_21865, partial [Thermodesulfobacteriota bacterium]
REELLKQKSYAARDASRRMYEFLKTLKQRTEKRYGALLGSERFRLWFEQCFAEVQQAEMNRAVDFETTMRRLERQEILSADLERRIKELEEDPGRLDEHLKIHSFFLSTQFQGTAFEFFEKKDHSTLILAAVKTWLEKGDIERAEGVLREHKGNLIEETKIKAFEAVSQALVQWVRLLPPAERVGFIDRHLPVPEVGEEEEKKEMIARKEWAFFLAHRDFQRYRADPLAYLEPEIRQAVEKEAAERGSEFGKKEAMAFRREIGLSLQDKIGGGPLRVLTNEEADRLHEAFMAAGATDKVALIGRWAEEYGVHLGLMLAEVQIPSEDGHSVAAELATDRDTIPFARTLMSLADRPLADLAGTGEEPVQVREMALAELGRTNLGRLLAGLTRTAAEELDLGRQAEGFRVLAIKLTLLNLEKGMPYQAAATLAARELDRCFPSLAQDDLALVLLPRSADREAVKEGLRRHRERLAAWNEESGLGLLVRRAVWINVGDGFGLYVPDQDTRGLISDEEGAPVILSPLAAELLGHWPKVVVKTEVLEEKTRSEKSREVQSERPEEAGG